MKLFNLLTRIICASFLITISPYVFAGWFSAVEAQKILDQNPHLITSGVLPPNMRVLNGHQCREFSDGDHIRNRDAFRASLKGVTSDHTCIRVESDKGFKSYERRYGETRSFTIVLHLDTPKVWRVYETKSTGRKEPPNALKLAEFGINGERVAATSQSSRQAGQIINSQSKYPRGRSAASRESHNPTTSSINHGARMDEVCAIASNTKSDSTIAECRIYRPGSPGSESNRRAGSPGGDDTSAPPPPAESQMEDVVKKSIGDLLKGFGR